jgi:hypothetical protein
LAWRDGQIVLDGDGFGEAAAEFNRYNSRKIVIVGQGLADEKLVGWFRTNEPESFARAAAASFGAQVTVRGDAILVQAQQTQEANKFSSSSDGNRFPPHRYQQALREASCETN